VVVAQARAGERYGKGFKLARRGAQAPAAALQKEAERGKRSPLVAILTIAVLAKLTGANQVRDVAEWATHRQCEVCALFGLTCRTLPHFATWSHILGEAVDPDALTGPPRRC
jgi:hypothetical protein